MGIQEIDEINRLSEFSKKKIFYKFFSVKRLFSMFEDCTMSKIELSEENEDQGVKYQNKTPFGDFYNVVSDIMLQELGNWVTS